MYYQNIENDTNWIGRFIKEKETNLKVIVYDRYGKTMASFDANSLGWNGTYNGQLMFSDDYWFVVYRQDGREHRGHFTLKR